MHVYRAYPNEEYAGEIQQKLTEAFVAAYQGAKAAKDQYLVAEEATYREWHERINVLMAEVADVYSTAIVQKDLFGNKKMPYDYLQRKVPVDSAILAIDRALEILYEQQRVRGRRRKIYHGAGMLYYLGFEQFNLRPKESFPATLIPHQDSIWINYRARRKEAGRYLSLKPVAEQMDHLRERLISQDQARQRRSELFSELLGK
jgi:hypothetical protein